MRLLLDYGLALINDQRAAVFILGVFHRSFVAYGLSWLKFHGTNVRKFTQLERSQFQDVPGHLGDVEADVFRQVSVEVEQNLSTGHPGLKRLLELFISERLEASDKLLILNAVIDQTGLE